jgi:hypothetical protein
MYWRDVYYMMAVGRMLGTLLREHRRRAWQRAEAYNRQLQAVPPVIKTFRPRPPETRSSGATRGW